MILFTHSSCISCIWPNFLGFFENIGSFQNWWSVCEIFRMGFVKMVLYHLALHSHLHYNNVSCILDICLLCWNDCVLVRLDWAKPMMFLLFHITRSCIFMHTYLTFSIFLYIDCDWCFSASLSLSPSPLFSVSCPMALNENLLHPKTLFVLGHPLLLILLPLMFGSVMIKLNRTFQRTFLDEAFIQNAKSFCRASPTLTYPLLYTVGVRSYCVTFPSLVHPCLYKSSTPTCMDLIIQYLSLLLTFEVRASWPLRILYPMCSMSIGSASWLPWLWSS